MEYFLPFWPADKIYPDFDVWKETYGEVSYQRIWEVFSRPPINGVLVSRVNMNKSKKLAREISKKGVHGFLKYSGIVMGDCGAFGYIKKDAPLYDPIETMRYYDKLGYDIGVSVDHLIVPETYDQRNERWQLTIDNAEKMFDEAQKSAYDRMRLIGVVQGWDADSYVRGAKELIDYGFNYIGLGGLTRSTTTFIEKLLVEIGKVVNVYRKKEKRRVCLHLFGVARESLFPIMVTVGVTSFDSTSFLRRAWIAARGNYQINRTSYTAIRVPLAKTKKKKELEQEVLSKIKLYDEGLIAPTELVNVLKEYDRERAGKMENEYLRTLTERPWKKCRCKICQSAGVHVCVFRMTERNMRRGFHNVYQFYKRFRQAIPRLLVFTMCTAKKDPSNSLMPAYQRYLPSPTFRNFWNKVYDVPLIEIGVFSAEYDLISWDTNIPKYERKLNESDLSRIELDLTKKLESYDKCFFIGLGLYLKTIKKIVRKLGMPGEIFPKKNLTNRDRLDIIEYMKQMSTFRERILDEIPKEYFLETKPPKLQEKIDKFVR